MILLKATALLIGMGTQASISIDHTVIPTMSECTAYLDIEEARLREVNQEVLLDRTETKLNSSVKIVGNTVMTTFECIKV